MLNDIYVDLSMAPKPDSSSPNRLAACNAEPVKIAKYVINNKKHPERINDAVLYVHNIMSESFRSELRRILDCSDLPRDVVHRFY